MKNKTLLTIIVLFLCVCKNSFAQQKVFHQQNAKGIWQYIYPFADKTYVLAIQNGVNKNEDDGLETSNIYFGKVGKTDKIFWKEQLLMRLTSNNVSYEDFNNDGVKDLLIFEDNGARSSNSFYNLYLINLAKHSLTKVKNFNQIVNPSYYNRHKVILSYAFAGENYYSIYRLNATNKPYKIGDGFKDTDDLDLDKKIAEVLRKNQK